MISLIQSDKYSKQDVPDPMPARNAVTIRWAPCNCLGKRPPLEVLLSVECFLLACVREVWRRGGCRTVRYFFGSVWQTQTQIVTILGPISPHSHLKFAKMGSGFWKAFFMVPNEFFISLSLSLSLSLDPRPWSSFLAAHPAPNSDPDKSLLLACCILVW